MKYFGTFFLSAIFPRDLTLKACVNCEITVRPTTDVEKFSVFNINTVINGVTKLTKKLSEPRKINSSLNGIFLNVCITFIVKVSVF